MRQGKRIAVVIPAYNEELHIEQVVHSIPEWVDHVVIVDDGSSDNTLEVACALEGDRVELHSHMIRKGVGAAIKTGYDVAFAAQADIAVVMAGDGQMDPGDLETLIAPLLGGHADYVKGNRFEHEARQSIPVARAFGNRFLTSLTCAVTGLSISDAQCGYTALTRDAAARIDLASLWSGYGYPNDMLCKLAKAKLRVQEVTVRPVYADEQSHLRIHHALLVPWVILRPSR